MICSGDLVKGYLSSFYLRNLKQKQFVFPAWALCLILLRLLLIMCVCVWAIKTTAAGMNAFKPSRSTVQKKVNLATNNGQPILQSASINSSFITRPQQERPSRNVRFYLNYSFHICTTKVALWSDLKLYFWDDNCSGVKLSFVCGFNELQKKAAKPRTETRYMPQLLHVTVPTVPEKKNVICSKTRHLSCPKLNLCCELDSINARFNCVVVQRIWDSIRIAN